MVLPLAALLLSGCHLLASGAIETTCDDLANCVGTSGEEGGSGVIDLPPPAAGVALAAVGEGSWLVSAFDPPDREVRLQRSGEGEWGGEIAFSAEEGRMYVADGPEQGAPGLYALGPGEDEHEAYDLPDAGPVVDLALLDGSIYVLMQRALVQVRAGGQVAVLSEAEADLDLRDLLARSDGQLYVLGLGDNGPDLYLYDPGSGTGALVAQDFAKTGERLGGDLFWGPGGALEACTASGAIHSVGEMLEHADDASYEPTPLGQLSADVGDVLACGWDEGLGRYLLASGGAGVLALLPGEPEVTLDLLADTYEIRGAAFY